MGQVVPFLRKVAPLAGLIALFALMAVLSWRKWPDVLVDFGRELYVPWQIAVGKVLYRDLAYINGPFSPYFNALWMKMFGVSFTVLIVVNLVLLAALLIVLYAMFSRICSRLTATVVCGIFTSVFAFSQYVFVGNYNYVCPYSHEATHGIALSILMIHQLWRFSMDQKRYHVILAGVALGCVALTKVDVCLGALAVEVAFIVLQPYSSSTQGSRAKIAAIMTLSALLPTIGFFFYFLAMSGFKLACRAILGAYWGLMDNGVAGTPFYVRNMGLDDISGNVFRMIISAALVLAVLTVLIWVSHERVSYRHSRFFQRSSMIIFAGIAALTSVVGPHRVYPIPVLVLLSLVMIGVRYWRAWHDSRDEPAGLLPLTLWAVFALFMLPKMVLESRLYHYGFYLAMPAVVLLSVMLTWFIPWWMSQKSSGAEVFRKIAVVVLGVFGLSLVVISAKFYTHKTYSIGAGADRIVTYAPESDPRSHVVQSTLEWLDQNLEDDATFLVLPEGVMLNYLSRHNNPSAYTSFLVPEVLMFGENAMVQNLAVHAPDYVLFVHRDMSEYGVDYFGANVDYGAEIMEWVNVHYQPVELFGFEPLRDEGFGIKILRRSGL